MGTRGKVSRVEKKWDAGWVFCIVVYVQRKGLKIAYLKGWCSITGSCSEVVYAQHDPERSELAEIS